jgi:protein-S-isoprenylcysteine O-methyltransferase Ste14
MSLERKNDAQFDFAVVVALLLKVVGAFLYLRQHTYKWMNAAAVLVLVVVDLIRMWRIVKCLENCRLLISRMFKQYSILLDYPLQRIVIMILLKEDIDRALNYSLKILK